MSCVFRPRCVRRASFEATLSLLADAPRPLGNRARVRFHLGTSEILARVVILEGDELRPGGRSYVHFRLENPVGGPAGRSVRHPQLLAGRHHRRRQHPGSRTRRRSRRTRAKLVEHLRVLEQGRPTERIERHLLAAGFAPMTPEALRARSDLDETTVAESLRELIENGRAIRVGAKEGDGTLHAERVSALRHDVLARLAEFHAKEPLKDGLAKEELRSKLPDQLPASTFVWMLAPLDDRRTDGGRPRQGSAGRLSSRHCRRSRRRSRGRSPQLFREAGLQPPAPEAVMSALKVEPKLAHAVFRRLVDDGVLVRVGEGSSSTPRAIWPCGIASSSTSAVIRRINVGTMKELFGLSRKYAIPYLEHLDAIRITRRQGDERVPYK